MSNSTASVQSVDRALTILERWPASGEAGVTDLADALEVHKCTAFRLVATLESHRLVEQTDGRGKYRLGIGLLRLAGATTARLDVVQEARPICRQLASDTGETVNVAVLSDRSALYLDQVAGSSALQSHNWVGQHIPLHATANGKVLLIGLETSSSSTDARPDAGLHGRTITPRQAPHGAGPGPRAGVRRGRRRARGRAAAAAAPIHNVHGDVIASMSVSGPRSVSPRSGSTRSCPLVEAAAEVSHRLGWGHGRSRIVSGP